MKIVFLEAVQNFGGARISTVELAQRFSEKNEVLLIDFYGSCEPFVKAVRNNNIPLEIAIKRETPYIISSSRSKTRNLLNLFLFVPHWFQLRRRIHSIIRNAQPDFIVVNNPKTLSTLFGFSGKRFKTLYFARGWFNPQSYSRFTKFLYRLLADRFVCVSEATRHALFCGGLAPLDKIYVVHNAIEEEKLVRDVAEIGVPDDCFKILHCGGFLPDKGQHISIEVARRLKAAGFKFRLILTGLVYKGAASAKYYEEILEMIAKYDLDQEVSIVQGQHNVIPYFRACDVVIHPSSTEGLPRVVMEAMCLRKPVVANAVGGVTDYILHGYTGFITQFNDPADYVEYILLLSGNKERYASVANSAYELIKTSYTKEEQLKQFNKVFSK